MIFFNRLNLFKQFANFAKRDEKNVQKLTFNQREILKWLNIRGVYNFYARLYVHERKSYLDKSVHKYTGSCFIFLAFLKKFFPRCFSFYRNSECFYFLGGSSDREPVWLKSYPEMPK